MGDATAPGMRRILPLAALITTLASGCALRGEYRGVAYVVDGTMVAAGAALGVAPEPDEWEKDNTSGDGLSDGIGQLFAAPFFAMHEVGVGMMIVGLAAALVNYQVNVDYVTPEDAGAQAAVLGAEELEPLPEMPGAHPDAVRMTKQARRAAVSGQCGPVRLLAPKVYASDAAYYVRVLRQDPPIRACL